MWKALAFTLLVCIVTYQTALAVPAEFELDGRGDEDIAPEDECEGAGCHNTAMKGEKGDTGAQGLPGFCDASSCSGLVIEKGEPGMKGEPGSDGIAGAPGVMGPPGLLGMKGEPGQAGMKGESGEPGTPGSTGVPGKPGLPGAPGSPGVDGSDGSPGEKGDKGEPGLTVQVLPEVLSESCTDSLQGTIRFDPDTKLLYFCNGTNWVCIQTMDCPGERPTCPSPFGPQQIGDSWYQVFVGNITQATQDAADIVLVIDESGTMSMEHEWLLVMIPLLESTLIENGVGDGEIRNRYCVIGFGSFGNLRRAHFRPVGGQPCYTATEFPLAQRQLIAAGLFEDGYEAIKFGLDNVPFRESPFIAKNILLVTDEGRTVIQEGASITRASIEAELKANNILLNAIVFADYALENDPNKTVIGVDARGKSLILEPNGGFSETDERVLITKAERNTAEDYVDLAVSVGGASWALRVLRESSFSENKALQESFTSALTQVKLREIRAVIESCRRCTCVSGEGGDSTMANCVIAEDETFCRCAVESGSSNTCESGLPGDDDDNRVSGGLVSTGNSITSIDRAPDFMSFNGELINP